MTGHFFEGAEKLLEIWFTSSTNDKGKPTTPQNDLRNIPRDLIEEVLDLVNCKVLRYAQSATTDTYVLSESSMFVFSTHLVLKTCGETTLLHAVQPLLRLARDYCELDTVDQLYYSRRKFLRPELQKAPHTSFEHEVAYLDSCFEGGSAYVLGRTNVDCWYLYILDKARVGSKSDQTLEVIMTDLDPKIMEIFYQENTSSTAEATKKAGIDKIFPNAKIFDYLFDPCGYSMNGLLPDGHYFTIHITPEPDFSYVSFETNVPYNQYNELIHKVIKMFNPGKFTTTIFGETAEPSLDLHRCDYSNNVSFGGKNEPTKKSSDNHGDEKRVFDINFGNNKNYAIDNCIPLAFGDFNADKIVDVFCRNTKGDEIRIMVNDDRSTTTKEIYKMNITGVIYDALAADFDGDSKLDLFILYKLKSEQVGYNGGILWGDRVKLSELYMVEYLFENIPTALDANGDSYVELLGMISTDQTTFKPACLFFKSRTVFPIKELPIQERLRPSATQATVDLNHDLVADLFLTLDVNNALKFRIYELPITNFKLYKEYDPPPGVAIYHLSTFADIDADGDLEHILPVCMDIGCSKSQIYVRDNDAWHQLPIKFGDGIRFPLKSELPPPLDQIPISIKVADYNLDGYPDIVTVMRQTSSGSTVPIVLQNRACESDATTPCTYNQTFTPQGEESFVLAATNATMAVFFDVLENGYPDLLVLQGSKNQNFKLIGFQNSLVQDVHFIKVMVISTFSCESCSRQKKLPYGNNQPGQSVKMETITIMNGIKDYWIKLAAVQMAQAGQMTLELPYVIIGLGSTPNFVEKITVGVPPMSESEKFIRTYTQMIPNSQIVVVPSPLTSPEKWHSKLFITPSRMILHTGIALGVSLVVLAGALAILQYREKVEDDRERKVQAQAFHYDAL
ncbi:hypothetical protein I4U23_001955 [Adineta vaga]|nr:hypothetical protein I4U23_001955 [Adineta vaga]